MEIADVKFILLISSFIVPLILAIVLLSQSNKDSVKLLVVLGLLNASAVFFFNYIYFQKYYQLYYYCNALHLATILWIFPIIYHIFKLLVIGKINYRKAFFHLIPGALIALFAAVLLYGFNTAELGSSYFENYRSGVKFDSQILRLIANVRLINVVLLVIQVCYYLIKIYDLSRQYRKKMKNESNIDRILYRNWISWFNLAFTSIALLCVLYYVYVPQKQHEDIFLIIFLFILALIIMFVAIMALSSRVAVANLQIPCNETIIKVEKNSEEKFIETIIQKMYSEQLFLNPELTLQELSQRLNTNRTYLSGVINRQTGMNFSTFVNEFRLKYIAQYKEINPKASAEKLAEIGGFGSVSSMRRAFKRDVM